MERICKQCGCTDQEENFALASTIKGKRYYRHLCKHCYTLTKNAYKDKQANFIRELKLSLSCERCGFSDHRALDFHHKDEKSKDGNIADLKKRGWSKDRILKEIAKCEVLCANCHRIEHAGA